MSYLDTLNTKRQENQRKVEQEASTTAVQGLASEIRTLLNSLEKTGTKKLDEDFINAVKNLGVIADSLKSVRVTSDSDIRTALEKLASALAQIDTKPVVNLPQPKVTVVEKELDLKPITDAIKTIKIKSPSVAVNLDAVSESVDAVKRAIEGLEFPVANYILPFKDSSGKATQVQLTSDGYLPIEVSAEITGAGLATEAKQDTIIGHLDGVETVLGTIDTDTGNIATDTSTIAGDTTSLDSKVTKADTDDVTVTSMVQPTPPTAVRNGQKTVAAAGTAEAISGSVAVNGVIVQALAGNAGNVFVGDSSVDSTNGFELQPGQATSVAIDNLNKVYVDAANNDDGVCFIGS